MLPHLGQARIVPMASALRTASRARHVVQLMENNAFSTVPFAVDQQTRWPQETGATLPSP